MSSNKLIYTTDLRVLDVKANGFCSGVLNQLGSKPDNPEPFESVRTDGRSVAAAARHVDRCYWQESQLVYRQTRALEKWSSDSAMVAAAGGYTAASGPAAAAASCSPAAGRRLVSAAAADGSDSDDVDDCSAVSDACKQTLKYQDNSVVYNPSLRAEKTQNSKADINSRRFTYLAWRLRWIQIGCNLSSW